ncbi:MAG TPA: UDP-3-O-acyl-N-acetylglucosamine deacetylase, partial [Xanthobacteraceae bacterium]|nr:UDP-3-O-acyl-N-acetylglucosamine deacetylase [Xanthobacteraceae bacterium]
MRDSGQTTLSERVDLMGRGVHSGAPAKVSISPADAGTGIVFIRHNGTSHEIPVSPQAVRNTDFATVLGQGDVEIATVEHLLAALSGLGVDNAIVDVDGGEVPIFDGSAHAFVEAIDGAGVEAQAAPRRYLKMLKPVRVEDGRAQGELLPYDGGFRV